MSVFDHEQESGRGGMGKVLAIGAAVIVLLAAGFFGVSYFMKPAPPPKEAPPPVKTEAPRPAPRAVEPDVKSEEPKAATRPKPKKEKPVDAAPAPPAPTGPTLVIESDVPGASVFVDRKYLGTTPLRSTEVTAGTHQLNASASGEDGLVQNVEVGGTGETNITLKFREVRLNAQLSTVHKHGIGSCSGTLTATPGGMRYETDNKKDAFAFALKDLEVFEIDYQKKELKVKQRGGRTWNFTDKSDNADKLFVFHRDVSKARERLAAQAK
ncbi:MAG: PEGA domain-containing protein [Acidobacteria bacterium]|nr:PEGA domain-containing protein [Acidobacteriota bacterium]